MDNNRFGPTVHDDGVTFRVYSPRARRMRLCIAPETPYEHTLELPRVDADFFELHVPGLAGGTRYRLQRDDRWPQADPASHFQPAGVFGPSEVIDHGRYFWQRPDWRGIRLEQMVLYELHVGTFSEQRTYDGVLQRLSFLRDTGINAIKLMPLATAAGRHNWGYDGVFHFAPFAPYGRPDQLRRLVDEAHALGIAVLLDVVSNHFGPEGNPMWDLARSFFAEHGNTAWGPGPRFERDAVMAYFDEMARHFRRYYRFDGLRVDAVDAIPTAFRSEHVRRLAAALEDSGPEDSHAVLMLELFDSDHDVLAHKARGCSVVQLNTEYQRASHRLLTGEAHSEYRDFHDPAADFGSCLGSGFAFFDRQSEHLAKAVGPGHKKALPWPTLVNYLVNHDTVGNRYLGQRLQTLISPRTFRAATALLLLQPGMPYLFMGQEWATERSFHFFTDFSDGLGRQVTKGRRRGFHELPDGIAGCPGRAPDPQQPEAFQSSTLDWSEIDNEPHASMLAFTRQLLSVRAQFVDRFATTTGETACTCQGAFYRIEQRRPGAGPLLLLANLSDAAHPAGEFQNVLYCSEGDAKEQLERKRMLAAQTVCLAEL